MQSIGTVDYWSETTNVLAIIIKPQLVRYRKITSLLRSIRIEQGKKETKSLLIEIDRGNNY